MSSWRSRPISTKEPMPPKPALLTRISTSRPRVSISAASASRADGVAEVAADRLGADPVRARQLVGELAQALLAAGGQRDAVAARGQYASDLGADARRGARDEGGG